MFKEEFVLEKYLVKLPDRYRISLCKLRTSSHCLAIEQGRYRNIQRNERLCEFCNVIGDEFHFLFECKHDKLVELRSIYIPRYYRTNPNSIKFNQLLGSTNNCVLLNLGKYCYEGFKVYK